MNTVRFVVVVFLVTGSAMFGLSVGIATSDSNSSTAIPDDGPDYGVNETRFPLLWSEDEDNDNLSSDDFEDDVTSPSEFATRLAKSTDVPFEEPPIDVETWNSGDFHGFSPGGEETSVHPEGAHLEDGLYIRDAHVSLFAVQPSTVLHSGNDSIHYIAPDGEVLAATDYRVRVPPGNTSGSVRHRWSIIETDLDRVELRVDGQIVDSNSSHRSTLEYGDLSGTPELTAEAEISVRLRHEVRTCTDYDDDADDCNVSWDTEIDHPTEQMTVTESRQTTVNRLDNVEGQRTTFESDTDHTGAIVHPDTAWSMIEFDDNARVRGNWRFYSAGKSGWHTIVSRTETDTTQEDSAARPAQIHAVPVEEQPDMPSGAMEDAKYPLFIEERWGSKREGPTLPEEIAIDTAETYLDVSSVAVRSETLSGAAFDETTVHGIVRGQSQTVSLAEAGTVRETNLELTVRESNSTGAVVQAAVTETSTGEPITIGRVEVGNQSAAVNDSGIAVLELEERPSLLIDGQYVPEEWWHANQLYSSAEDRTSLPPEYPRFQKIVQLVLVTLFWFLPVALAVYGFDYLSGGTFLGLTDRQ